MVQVTDEMVRAYQADGVVLVKGLMAGWVEALRAGVEANMAAPGQPMPTLKPGEQGNSLTTTATGHASRSSARRSSGRTRGGWRRP